MRHCMCFGFLLVIVFAAMNLRLSDGVGMG